MIRAWKSDGKVMNRERMVEESVKLWTKVQEEGGDAQKRILRKVQTAARTGTVLLLLLLLLLLINTSDCRLLETEAS
jgi:hypothetical protein